MAATVPIMLLHSRGPVAAEIVARRPVAVDGGDRWEAVKRTYSLPPHLHVALRFLHAEEIQIWKGSMAEVTRPGRRTFAGLVVAIFVGPFATAACLAIAILLSPRTYPMEFWDFIGGSLTFLVIALLFGGLLAALPTLIIGSIVIATARSLGTNSPVFFATAGLLAGLAMAWIDIQRSQSIFNILEAIPFLIGGCSSALSYWWVAER